MAGVYKIFGWLTIIVGGIGEFIFFLHFLQIFQEAYGGSGFGGGFGSRFVVDVILLPLAIMVPYIFIMKLFKGGDIRGGVIAKWKCSNLP